MYKIIYPRKDATIYERYPERNTGIDEILELTKFAVGEPHDDVISPYASWEHNYNSRILMQFDMSDLSGVDTGSAEYYLAMRATEAQALALEYQLEAFPLAESWINGNGHYNDEPEITNGVSWNYKSGYQINDEWNTGSYSHSYSSVTGGGTWNETYHATQSFSFESPDVWMNITPIGYQFANSLISNNGIIIKHTNVNEQSDEIFGSLKFFGRESHTIYKPKIVIFWDEGISYTGSFTNNSEISNNYVIYIKNLKGIYRQSENVKLRIGVRDMFPTRTYATSSTNVTERKLPSTSYFSIIDDVTGIDIVPFNTTGTKVLMDDNGHYINLDTDSFSKKRYYRILFKIINDNGTEIIDRGFNFRVE